MISLIFWKWQQGMIMTWELRLGQIKEKMTGKTGAHVNWWHPTWAGGGISSEMGWLHSLELQWVTQNLAANETEWCKFLFVSWDSEPKKKKNMRVVGFQTSSDFWLCMCNVFCVMYYLKKDHRVTELTVCRFAATALLRHLFISWFWLSTVF